MSSIGTQWAVSVCVAWLVVCCVAQRADGARNLLRSLGFEEPLAPAWEKRTPEDQTRKLYRTDAQARSGTHCVVLENLAEAYTRLRQGHDRAQVTRKMKAAMMAKLQESA